MEKLDIKSIIQKQLSKNQYLQEKHTKTQIYLHHTAGNEDPINTANWFQKDPKKIGTAFIIGGKSINKTYKDGDIVQCFSSAHWAYHLGLKEQIFKSNKVPYLQLDKISIGIEICNWGQLTFKNGKYYAYTGKEIPSNEVTVLSTEYKGYKYFHAYTDAQIESLRKLIIYLQETYKIKFKYSDDIFKININALKGNPGIYTHNSVRLDKVDIYPCPRLITMLKSLK